MNYYVLKLMSWYLTRKGYTIVDESDKNKVLEIYSQCLDVILSPPREGISIDSFSYGYRGMAKNILDILNGCE